MDMPTQANGDAGCAQIKSKRDGYKSERGWYGVRSGNEQVIKKSKSTCRRMRQRVIIKIIQQGVMESVERQTGEWVGMARLRLQS